jgi:ABC-type nitrate/sulfonate/bicarbonate transport system ATPase subunit
MSATVSVRALTRTYGSTVALRTVSVDFRAGTRTAVIGPSGSGKSSLLQIVAGLDTGYDGGLDVAPERPRLGYAFQDARLLPWLSVADNIAFALVAARWGRPAIAARVDELLQLVGLTDAAEQFPRALSGGMRQRVSLARALAARPGLVLLDEPFSAVDEEQAEQLCARVRAETMLTGATLIVVTHRLREAVLLADRAVLLDRGQVTGDVPFPRGEPGDPEIDTAVEGLLRSEARRRSVAPLDVRR